MDKQEHLENLSEIRSIMERSSRFISLSGLSGVFAGIFALAGAWLAWQKLESPELAEYSRTSPTFSFSSYYYFVIDALCVLAASLTAGALFTMRKAKRKGLPLWDATTKRLLINLLIPLATGGIFCLMMMYHRLFALVAPATLIFYGLALINASKYTLHDIRALGICQIILGLFASVFLAYGLFFWAFGFGILHILYGTIMYYKYER